MLQISFSMRRLALGLALLMALPIASCGQGKVDIPGIDRFTVNVLQKRLYVSFVATELRWDDGLTFPIPGLKDATISVSPDISSDGTVFQVAIPLASIINDRTGFPYSGFPDGRALPDVAGGELPRRDFRIKDVDLSLYLSDDAFGFFVPLKLGSGGKFLTSLISVFIEDEH